MRLLLDTCTFLWIAADSPRLSPRVREEFVRTEHEVYLSSASSWEIAVKHRLGRLPLPVPPQDFVPRQRKAHGIEPLPIDEESALHVAQLPDLHNDPFDRMLVAQALVHALVLVTPDEAIRQYAVRHLW